METQEEERQRIARNVHDDVGTLLNVAKMQLEASALPMSISTKNSDNSVSTCRKASIS